MYIDSWCRGYQLSAEGHLKVGVWCGTWGMVLSLSPSIMSRRIFRLEVMQLFGWSLQAKGSGTVQLPTEPWTSLKCCSHCKSCNEFPQLDQAFPQRTSDKPGHTQAQTKTRAVHALIFSPSPGKSSVPTEIWQLISYTAWTWLHLRLTLKLCVHSLITPLWNSRDLMQLCLGRFTC